VHFKAYDGNQTDDGIHLETWSDVRWDEILRKRADRNERAFDVIECAVGPYHLREGFTLYWYRSSQKKKRDERDRNERIERTRERLETLDLRRMRGPKTEATIRKRVSEILTQHHAEEWITIEIKWDAVEKFKAITRGKPTADTPFRRIIQRVPRLHISTNAANIARSAALDGIFPLTTNTKEKPVDVFKIYKYQPRIERRHTLLKSTLDVAPIWLKKNIRIEALMFLEFVAQIIAALIERDLRKKMVEKDIDLLCSLPEGRPSKTPTIEQVLRLFENQSRHALYDGDRLIKQFADPLTKVQSQMLQLLEIPTAIYGPGR